MTKTETRVSAGAYLMGLRNCALCGAKLTYNEKVESVRLYQTLLCRQHQDERAEGDR